MVHLLDKTRDQLITLPGTWEGFKLVQQGLQDSPEARLAFYDGAIEILMPGELPRYQALGVPEVWFWQDGTLELYHLSADGYQRIERSRLPGLEELDID